MYNLIEINVYILFFYLLYVIIKNKINFTNRKRLLLLIPLFSLLIIGIKELITIYSEVTPIAFLELDLFEISQSELIRETNWFKWEYLYFAGVAISIAVLIFKLIRITNFFKKLNFDLKDGIKIYQSNTADSFTFLNKIHLNSSDYSETPIIEEHERIHVEKKHTIELLLMEIYQLICWFNPIIYLMKWELKRTQEYQVDQILFEKYKETYIEILLSNSLQISKHKYLLTSQFSNKLNLAKRSIIMKNSINQNLKLVAVIPVLVLLFSFVTWTSDDTPIQMNPSQLVKDEIVQPQFPGGNEAMFKFLSENIKYPEAAKKANKEGVVYVGFVVNKRGKIKKVIVKRKVDEELDAEAVRVIKSMPRWTPGTINGKKANVEMVVPINYKLK